MTPWIFEKPAALGTFMYQHICVIDWSRELMSSLLFAMAYLLLFFIGECLRRIYKWHPEVTRKTIHLASCLIAMLFPFFLHSVLSVLILTCSFALILLLARKCGWLASVNDVKRGNSSLGCIALPAAVFVCFFWAKRLDIILFYEISILVLAFSDSAAALIGTIYGLFKYDVEGTSRKSFEGSVIFFLSTFLVVEIMLLLFAPMNPVLHITVPNCLLVALWISIWLTFLEALSLNGWDNLIVPTGTMYILCKNISPSTAELTIQFIAFGITLFILTIMARPYHKVSRLGVLELGLVVYTAWGLLDLSWAIPMFVALLFFYRTDWIMSSPVNEKDTRHVRIPFYYVIVPTIWFLLANWYWNPTTRAQPYFDFSDAVFYYLKGASSKTLLFYPGFLAALVGQLFLCRQKVRLDGGKKDSFSSLMMNLILLWATFHIIGLPIFIEICKGGQVFCKFHAAQWTVSGGLAFLTIVMILALYRPVFCYLEKNFSEKGFPRIRMLLVLLLSALPNIVMFWLYKGGIK